MYVDSFVRHLRAENASERTIQTYAEAVSQLTRFCAEMGMPNTPTGLTREHVEAFVARLLETKKPATASNHHRSLQVFFKWLVEEGEMRESPMVRMKPPKVPEEPAPVLGIEDIMRILNACKGVRFEERRDTAIIRVLLDTGLRRAELANLHVENVDWSENPPLLRVQGKGGRIRHVPVGRKAARDLDRYLRVKARHRVADSPNLWLGKAGPMTDSGIYQVVRDRAAQAGPGLRASIRTCSHTPSLISGCRPKAKKATSCVWPGGAAEACLPSMAGQRPMSGRARLTSG